MKQDIQRTEFKEFKIELDDDLTNGAPEEYVSLIQTLRDRIGSLEEQVNSLKFKIYSANDPKECFERCLDTEVPNWRDLISTPEFLEWLNCSTSEAGISHKQTFDRAFNSLQWVIVSRIFRSYCGEAYR